MPQQQYQQSLPITLPPAQQQGVDDIKLAPQPDSVRGRLDELTERAGKVDKALLELKELMSQRTKTTNSELEAIKRDLIGFGSRQKQVVDLLDSQRQQLDALKMEVERAKARLDRGIALTPIVDGQAGETKWKPIGISEPDDQGIEGSRFLIDVYPK